MPKYPGATWKPLDRYKPGGRSCVPMSKYDAGVGHTAVANWTNTEAFQFFNVPGRASPHLYFPKSGKPVQLIDTDFRSSAVLNGNHRCITWEAWDGGHEPIPPYTDSQVSEIAKFCHWLSGVHGIPLVQMPDSRPESKGIGWHRLGINGNFPTGLLRGRIEGGEVWSLATGKTCPTDVRIKQYPEQIIPMAAGGTMDWSDQLAKWKPGDPVKNDTMRAGQQLSQSRGYALAAYQLLLGMADVDKFATAVAEKVSKDVDGISTDQMVKAVKTALREGVDE